MFYSNEDEQSETGGMSFEEFIGRCTDEEKSHGEGFYGNYLTPTGAM